MPKSIFYSWFQVSFIMLAFLFFAFVLPQSASAETQPPFTFRAEPLNTCGISSIVTDANSTPEQLAKKACLDAYRAELYAWQKERDVAYELYLKQYPLDPGLFTSGPAPLTPTPTLTPTVSAMITGLPVPGNPSVFTSQAHEKTNIQLEYSSANVDKDISYQMFNGSGPLNNSNLAAGTTYVQYANLEGNKSRAIFNIPLQKLSVGTYRIVVTGCKNLTKCTSTAPISFTVIPKGATPTPNPTTPVAPVCAYESFVVGTAPVCTKALEGNTYYGSRCTCKTPTPTPKPVPTPVPWEPQDPVVSSPVQERAADTIAVLDEGIAKLQNLINTTNDSVLKISATQALASARNYRSIIMATYNRADYYNTIQLANVVIKSVYQVLKEPIPDRVKATIPIVGPFPTPSLPTPANPGVPTPPQGSISTPSNVTLAEQVKQLMAKVDILQQQLIALQQGKTPTATSLTQNLARGSQGAEVSHLQTILASLGYLDDENISGYFGTLTEAAVKKFQCDKGIICAGTPGTTGYGRVGKQTLVALNATTEGVAPKPICPIPMIANPPAGCTYVSKIVPPNTCPTYQLKCSGTAPTKPTTPTPTCPSGTSWSGSVCEKPTAVITGPAPTAIISLTFDNSRGGTATSKTTRKDIKEKCYIPLGKSSCSVKTSWTTENATHAVLTFPDVNRDYPDLDLYNDPRFRTEGLTGSRTMVLARKPRLPRLGYDIGGIRETLILNNSTDGQNASYLITLTAVCSAGEWDRTKGICAYEDGSTSPPPTRTPTPTPVPEPTPTPTPVPEPTSKPTASFTISPSGTLTYPTLVTYTLSSTNAKSCSVVDYMGVTYVSPSDNLTSKTITSVTHPQSTVFATKCWSGLNGTGVVSPMRTSSVIVKCPTNTAWDGANCK